MATVRAALVLHSENFRGPPAFLISMGELCSYNSISILVYLPLSDRCVLWEIKLFDT